MREMNQLRGNIQKIKAEISAAKQRIHRDTLFVQRGEMILADALHALHIARQFSAIVNGIGRTPTRTPHYGATAAASKRNGDLIVSQAILHVMAQRGKPMRADKLIPAVAALPNLKTRVDPKSRNFRKLIHMTCRHLRVAGKIRAYKLPKRRNNAWRSYYLPPKKKAAA